MGGDWDDWDDLGRVVFAGVLCPPLPLPTSSMKEGDLFAAERPLMGVW